MAEKKMTRKEALEFAIDNIVANCGDDLEKCGGDVAIEVINKMLASIEKQSKRPRGTSRVRIENEKLADNLVGEMVAYGKPVNTRWITEHVQYILTPQKATAVCKVAMDKGDIIRTVDEKKKVWYSLAE